MIAVGQRVSHEHVIAAPDLAISRPQRVAHHGGWGNSLGLRRTTVRVRPRAQGGAEVAGGLLEVPVAVLRDGEMSDLTVVLGRRETSEAVAFPASTEEEAEDPAQSEILGLMLSEITPELTDQFSLSVDAGLVITAINPDSEAASKGILEGDVITEAGQEPITSVADFQARIEAAADAGRKSILLLVRRGGDPRFVALVLEE